MKGVDAPCLLLGRPLLQPSFLLPLLCLTAFVNGTPLRPWLSSLPALAPISAKIAFSYPANSQGPSFSMTILVHLNVPSSFFLHFLAVARL